MTGSAATRNAAPGSQHDGTGGGLAARLLAEVRQLVAELRPGHVGGLRVALDSTLERELGLDSLARAELLLRLERAFGVPLPERLLAEAETPRDLLRAVGAAARAAAATREAPPDPAGEPLDAPLGEAEAAPDSAPTLLAALAWHAERHPARRHLLLLDGEGGTEELRYGELQRRATTVAAGLLARGLAPGDAVALMLPSSSDYFTCFLGVQLAGGVPVPLYPPARRSQVEDHLRRQARIMANARARLLVAAAEVRPLARLLSPLAPELDAVVTPDELASREALPLLPPVGAGDVAFLQYTSGSTGDPKGVVLSHANLLANLRAAGRAIAIGGDDVLVSWLPLYHDMGLIGAWMGSLYFGMPLVLMSPLAFLSRPGRWLQAIHRYRGTIAAAPNFAYALCVRKVSDEELAGLDLSCWRVAMNGAEPVSPSTLDAFCGRFAAAGFRREAMMPVYGLAEATLAVAFTPVGRGPRLDCVARRPFQSRGEAVPVPAADECSSSAPFAPAADTAAPAAGDGVAEPPGGSAAVQPPLRFVSCGYPVPGHEVRVVDEGGRELPERRQGRLQVRGPSVTAGYFRNPEATARLLRGDWMETGDLGYVADGEVFVTGRSKDLIIRAGRNLHPQELEEAVGTLPGARKGCVAVFATGAAGEGTERLVVMAETRAEGQERERLRRLVAELAIDLTGAPADEVVLVPPGTVPKTSSGKVRRAAAQALHQRGQVARRGRALWWQLGRLAGAGLPARLARSGRRAGELVYALWCWAVFLLLAPPVYLAVVVLPGRALRRRVARGGARLLARGAGREIRVDGELPHGPCVLVCNHQSYVDGFTLTAVLPPRLAFAVKAELGRHLLTRLPLSRLGALFVDRHVAERGAEQARRGADLVSSGDSLLVFPEATFRRAPGLLPFRMGAFVAAAEAGVPVVPMALRGTRSLLRAGEWLPRPAALSLRIGEPIAPGGGGWSDAVALREAARAWMLAHLPEPDLGGEELLLPPPPPAG